MALRPKWIPTVIVIWALTYFNQVVSNIISYRQYTYSLQLEKRNLTLTPLTDLVYTEWFPTREIPYVEQIGLLTAVDILCVVYSVGAVLLWSYYGKNLQNMSEVLTVEIILLPIFVVAQWFIIIPDSLPHCLLKNNIPRDLNTDWIWTRFGRACGNMVWSSDMVQIVIFTKLYYQTITKKCKCGVTGRCVKLVLFLIGMSFVTLFIAIALAAKYQYSSDMFITMFFTFFVCTHHIIPKIARCCFIQKTSERATTEEITPLNNDRV